MAKATSKDGKEYQIGSERGNDFLNNAKAGTTMTGGDGSTWTKNADGSTTISKNGTTYTVGGGSTGGNSGTSGGAPSGFKGSATNVNTYTRDQDAIKAEMNANSKKWHSATQEEQEQLHAANEALSRLLGGDVSFDAASGTWNGSAEQVVQKPSGSSGKSNFTDFVYEEAPSYNNRYEEKVDDLVQEILQRDPFSYSTRTIRSTRSTQASISETATSPCVIRSASWRRAQADFPARTPGAWRRAAIIATCRG